MSARHVIAAALALSAISLARADELDLAARFPRYTDYDPAVPVYLMPGERLLHRFFDTSPISPSGRYLAVFRLPYEGQTPKPGDAGEVVVIDLKSGQSRVVATSRGWETQVGANVQWGPSDAELWFNDVDPQTWQAFAVCLDPQTGQRKRLAGTVFMVSPDGKTLASHNLVKSRLAQVGYGVVIPDDRVAKNVGPVADDGVYLTDVATGRTRMLVSLKTIYENAVPSIRLPNLQDFEYYAFQVKWNRQGTRLMISLQWAPPAGKKRERAVITMKADGTDLRTAISAAQWAAGGHHIHWCPDGEHVSMNLNVDGKPGIELVSFRYDGSEMRQLFPVGSGHPSFNPAGRYLITDAYPYEPVAFADGSVPLRLIDADKATCQNIVRVFVSSTKGEFRLDAHPAWDPSGRYVVFNGLADNTRRVYIADLGGLLGRSPPPAK
jgi:hypothetical protein